MALTDESNGMAYSIPVQPMNFGGGFGNSFGGDGAWLILFLLLIAGNGGWGNGFGGGNVGNDLYPWMNQSNQMNDGFRDQMINSNIQGIQSAVTSGFGDTALGIAGINQNICQTGNGIIGQMYNNTIADLERSFSSQTATTQGMNAIQSQLASCCCDNRLATNDLKYTIATENCADRTAAAQNTRDIIDAQTRGTQAVLDKLCQLELDGVKGQLAQAERDNVGLQNQLNMANLSASQSRQTADIQSNIINELRSCPIPCQPVYGSQPIFTCNGNNGGCGCGNF